MPWPISSAFTGRRAERPKSAMEVNLEMLRFYSETGRRLGKSAKEIHEELTFAWGEDIVGYSTVRRYINDMKEGRDSLHDGRAGSSGRKSSIITEDTIEEARKIVNEDPQITIEDLAGALEISKGSAHTILHRDLSLRSLCSRWIPYSLNDNQKASRMDKAKEWIKVIEKENNWTRIIVVDEKIFSLYSAGSKRSNRCWVSDAADRTRIVRTSPFSKKIMVMCAVTFTGKFHIEILKKNEKIDSSRYVQFIKSTIQNFSRHVKPLTWENSLLIQDNARPHTARATREFYEKKSLSTLAQPAYSPDFNLLDRFIFSYLEQQRAGCDFEDGDALKIALTDALKRLTKDQWEHSRVKLLNDLKLIIDAQGDYL